MINSYGSVYALGHKAVADILRDDIEATEKIDGSQLSFGMIDGELSIRSKGQQLHLGANNGMFTLAVQNIEAMAGNLKPNWVYRGEYLMKPKHNTLCYNRVPLNNIIIFDIERGAGTEDYLRWKDRFHEAERIGLESIPTLAAKPLTLEEIKAFLTRTSVLGGVTIEGVVVKNYNLFTEDKKIAKAKFVSSEFQEKHQREWKKTNPGRQDIIAQIIDTYKTEARWQKAVQHLREDGTLEGSPRDIGLLIKTAQEDLLKEESEAIKAILLDHFKSQIIRGSTAGLPAWYKEKLAEGDVL